MNNIFRKLGYRLADYYYVTYWQLMGLRSRKNTESYIDSNSKRPPVIIIPGIYEPWWFMKPLVDKIHDEGYSVYAIEKLGYNRGNLAAMASVVDSFIRIRNLSDVIIVAHSKGGLIAKYLLANYNHKNSIRHVIAINTPFVGSKYAYLAPVRSIRAFLPSGKDIRTLQANKIVNGKITSIYSRYDPHIPEGSHLDGADNIELESSGHFRILSDEILYGIISKTLAVKVK